MKYKEELLPLSFKQSKAIIAKIVELGITPDMTDEDKDELVIKLSKDKAETSEKPYTSHLKGMEWYVNNLIEKSSLEGKELLERQYNEMLPYNSSFDELAAMLEGDM